MKKGQPYPHGSPLYVQSGTNCYPSSTYEGYEYFLYTAEIDPSEFVSATTTTVVTPAAP